MELSTFSRFRGIILLLIVVVIVIATIMFYRTNTYNEPTPGVKLTTIPPVSVATISPISPLSPVSPIPPTITKTQPDPAEIEAIIKQGIALNESHDYQGAIEKFNRVLALDPNNILAHNGRGSVYTNLKDYEQAINDYSTVIELEPLFPAAYYNRGRVYSFLKQYDKAISDLQKSIELSPGEFGYRANGNIGLIYHQQGQYDKALETFGKSISLDNTKADVFYFRGETYTALNNYQAAITDYQAAIQRFLKYALAYQSLGYAYYKTQQFSQAQEALKQALAITPNSPMAHFYLMLVYLSTNDITSANDAASQAANSLSTLSKEDQQFILTRIQNELKFFTQENPTKAKDVETLIKLIPKPN
jgi:tetratricopeptide (TPR) repeat protein